MDDANHRMTLMCYNDTHGYGWRHVDLFLHDADGRELNWVHWQVTEAGDGVELWGTAEVHDDLDTKRRLWDGVFDYDLNLFSPGGADGSPNTVFVAVRPQRAVAIKAYGMGGRQTWSAGPA